MIARRVVPQRVTDEKVPRSSTGVATKIGDRVLAEMVYSKGYGTSINGKPEDHSCLGSEGKYGLIVMWIAQN